MYNYEFCEKVWLSLEENRPVLQRLHCLAQLAANVWLITSQQATVIYPITDN